MKSIYQLLVLSFLLLNASHILAQRGEKIENLRIAFISNKLSLTTPEAEKFWPIYNVYRSAVSDLRKQTNLDMNLEAMSDAEAEKAIQVAIDRMEKELVLFKNLARDLKPVIAARKIAILSKVERSFNEELIRRSQLQEGIRPGLKRN